MTNLMQNSQVSDIDNSPGFIVGKMEPNEIETIRAQIRDHYLLRILAMFPEQCRHFGELPMAQYHHIEQLVNHRQLWPKRARILSPGATEIFKSLPFFQRLKADLNIVGITGEEESGWEEVYWRIVRPGKDDVGSLHADKWFWDLGHGEIKQGLRRIKIWIAVDTVPGKSGLRLLPNSHSKDDWRYHSQLDDSGIAKPVFDENVSELDILNVETSSGDFILFHDKLIHGGMPNMSDQTRVSLEATLLVKE